MASIGPQIPEHLLNARRDEEHNEEEEEEAGPSIEPSIGPQIPTSLPPPPSTQDSHADEKEEDDEDDYAPALPPHLLAAKSTTTAQPKKVLGPTLPSSSSSTSTPSYPPNADYDESSDEDIGPQPASYAPQSSHGETDYVKQFREKEESRRKKIEEAAKPKAPQREEWMLVPPSASELLGKLDPTKLSKARQFSNSTAPPVKDSDTSLWTETPAERQQRIMDEISGKRKRLANADAPVDPDAERERKKRVKYEEDIRRQVEEHTRKTRGPALVASHAEAMKKTEKDKKDDNMIWDHARDMSVGGRLLSDGDRNKMIRDARSLGDRFGSSKGGYS